MDELNEFEKMSRYAGEREDLVQAGGGNSSVKLSDQKMAIKSSGIQMADIKTDYGYSIVDYKFILNSMKSSDDTESDMIKECTIEGMKPSIETFLHSMTLKYTLHTHPVLVNAIVARTTWKEELLQLFPDAIFVEYKKPGLELAKEMFKKIQSIKSNPELVFLQNHGLIVSGEDAEQVIDRTNYVIESLANHLNISAEELKKEVNLRNTFHSIQYNNDKILYRCCDYNIVNYMDSYLPQKYFDIGFCPDCIVYAGYKVCMIQDDIASDLKRYHSYYGDPTIILYDKKVFVCAETIKKAKEIESLVSFGIKVIQLNNGSKMNYLSNDEKTLLLNWDAEKYRRGL